jgi:hypothetical protein
MNLSRRGCDQQLDAMPLDIPRFGLILGITMEHRLLTMACAMALLAGSVASAPASAFIVSQVRAPALIRLDTTRPNGMPGSPRDVAAARDFDNGATVEPVKPVRKRRHPTH